MTVMGKNLMDALINWYSNAGGQLILQTLMTCIAFRKIMTKLFFKLQFYQKQNLVKGSVISKLFVNHFTWLNR